MLHRRLTAFSDAAVRCLQRLDTCKEAGLRAIRLNAADQAQAKEGQEPFVLLSGLEEALRDTFGSRDGYALITAKLGEFTRGLDPADPFSSTKATAASVTQDAERLELARRELRTAILRCARQDFVFRMGGGRHLSAG